MQLSCCPAGVQLTSAPHPLTAVRAKHASPLAQAAAAVAGAPQQAAAAITAAAATTVTAAAAATNAVAATTAAVVSDAKHAAAAAIDTALPGVRTHGLIKSVPPSGAADEAGSAAAAGGEAAPSVGAAVQGLSQEAGAAGEATQRAQPPASAAAAPAQASQLLVDYLQGSNLHVAVRVACRAGWIFMGCFHASASSLQPADC